MKPIIIFLVTSFANQDDIIDKIFKIEGVENVENDIRQFIKFKDFNSLRGIILNFSTISRIRANYFRNSAEMNIFFELNSNTPSQKITRRQFYSLDG